MPLIEDETLRQLYATSSEEHLANIESGLLALERASETKRREGTGHPAHETGDEASGETSDGAAGLSPELWKDLLREAHSLKGDSRMLGVKEVESLIHQVEHLLGGLQRNELTLEPPLSDRLYETLDALRKIVAEATTGQPSGVDSFRLLAALMALTPAPAASPAIAPDPTPPAPPAPVPAAPQDLPPPPDPAAASGVSLGSPSRPGSDPIPPEPSHPPQTGEPYRIETIRVATRHLDALMAEVGELTVARMQGDRSRQVIEELAQRWEELRRWLGKGAVAKLLPQQEGWGEFSRCAEQFEGLLRAAGETERERAARLDAVAGRLDDQVRQLRLLPLSAVLQLLPRAVRDLATASGKQVRLTIEGGDTPTDKQLLEALKDPLLHLVRNAIDHGLELPEERTAAGKPAEGHLWVRAQGRDRHLTLELGDDGRGLNWGAIQERAIERGLIKPEELAGLSPDRLTALLSELIFRPGFTTRRVATAVSGRGIGLDVVRANVERLKGTVRVVSLPAGGSRFVLSLPTSLTTASVLLVVAGEATYALPAEAVCAAVPVGAGDRFVCQGRPTIWYEKEPLSVVGLAELLGVASSSPIARHQRQPCVILQAGEARLGVLVERLLSTEEVVLKPLSKLLAGVQPVSGATILGNGEVCIILSPSRLLALAGGSTLIEETAALAPARSRRILLVEDSIAVRTQEKRILEAAGYEVTVAVDGLDGWHKLRSDSTFDAIISDVQMPNLDGLGLTERIRERSEYDELPILLLTSLASEADRRRGAEAGANAYLTKGDFDQTVLLETLARLV